jgi:hypothetical protein
MLIITFRLKPNPSALTAYFIWVILGCSVTVLAQQQSAVQTHAWVVYQGNHLLNDRFSIHTEYQFRRHQYFEEPQQSLTRIGLDYAISKKVMVTAGYGWIVTYPYGQFPVAYQNNEHRIWQQLVLRDYYGRFYTDHRYRLEQRFLETKKLNSTGVLMHDDYVFRQRIRYRFNLVYPINKSTLTNHTLFAYVNDEIFLGFGKGVGRNIMDQNRLMAGLGWKVNNQFTFQSGYLNQYIQKPDGDRRENNHTVWGMIQYHLDFRKSEDTPSAK